MHQHQEHQLSPPVSVPVGSMSRPSKAGSQSHQDNNSSAAAVGAAGAGAQRQAPCDEAALLALLKRLGLALSPPTGPNGSHSYTDQDNDGDGGSNSGSNANNAMETQQQQQQSHARGGSHQHPQRQHVNGSAYRGDNGRNPGRARIGSRHGRNQDEARQISPFAPRDQQLQLGAGPHDHDPTARAIAASIGVDARCNPAHRHDASRSPTARNQTQTERSQQEQWSGGRRGRGAGGGAGGEGRGGNGDERDGGAESGGGRANRGLTAAAAAAADGMVDLMRCEITAKEAVLLGPILLAAKGVVSLKLCYNHLRDGGAEAVSTAIERHPSLHTMDLGFNDISDQGAASLARSLSSNRSLKTLYLSGNSIGPPGARALAVALAPNGGLTTLHLSGNCIGPEGAAALAEALRSNSSLTRLYIDGAGIKARGACAVASALVTNKVLSDLHMSDNEIGDEGLEGIAHALRRNRAVRLLELCFNRITPAGAEAFSKSIWGCTSLRTLRLDNNQVGDRGARALASALPNLALETLDLGFNNVAAAGVGALLQAAVKSPAFTSLSLSGNALDAEAAKAIQAALAQPRCALRRLSIDHTSLGRASESFIATGILSNRCLTLTTLTGFRLGAAFARLGMPPQVEEFSNAQALEQVRLYWANHGNAAGAAGRAGAGAGPGYRLGAVAGTGGLASLSHAAASTGTAEPAAVAAAAAGGRSDVSQSHQGHPTGAGGRSESSAPERIAAKAAAGAPSISYQGSSMIGTAGNDGMLSSGTQPGVQVVAAQSLPPHHLRTGPAGTHGGGGGGVGIGVTQGRPHDGAHVFAGNAGRDRGGERPGSAGEAATASLKACRVVVGNRSAPPAHATNQARIEGPGVAGRGVCDGEGGVWSRQSLVHSLHEIAKLPFSAAELWSLHQYYFSPAPGQQGCPESPRTSATPTSCGSSKPNSAAAAQKIPPIALPPSGYGRSVAVGTSSDAARLSLSRQLSERTGSSGAQDLDSSHNNGSSASGGGGVSTGRQKKGSEIGGAARSEGFATGSDGVFGEGPGAWGTAGARRSRRSSSLGGEDDEDDDADSPRPPSKRYRNASTKTRIACFPLVQDRIRVLKSKPDEHGVLTLLRQLKFLTTNAGNGSGRDEGDAPLVAIAGRAHLGAGSSSPGSHGRALPGPGPELPAEITRGGRGRIRGCGRGGKGARTVAQNSARNDLTDQAIEQIILEEL